MKKFDSLYYIGLSVVSFIGITVTIIIISIATFIYDKIDNKIDNTQKVENSIVIEKKIVYDTIPVYDTITPIKKTKKEKPIKTKKETIETKIDSIN